MTEPTEKDFDAMLARLKAKHPDFDLQAERGKLMMRKREEDLTDAERAFLRGDKPKMQ